MNQHFIDPNDIQQLIEALEVAAACKWPGLADQQHSLFGLAAQALRKMDKPEEPTLLDFFLAGKNGVAPAAAQRDKPEQPTLRDYFAAKALPEIMRGEDEITRNSVLIGLGLDRETIWDDKYWDQYVAMRSYEIADAMIAVQAASKDKRVKK
jgi:hypothetical protein